MRRENYNDAIVASAEKLIQLANNYKYNKRKFKATNEELHILKCETVRFLLQAYSDKGYAEDYMVTNDVLIADIVWLFDCCTYAITNHNGEVIKEWVDLHMEEDKNYPYIRDIDFRTGFLCDELSTEYDKNMFFILHESISDVCYFLDVFYKTH